MTGTQVKDKRLCPQCGVVTRHGTDGTCQGCGHRDVPALPLAELEAGRRERPVIVLMPRNRER